MYMLIFQVVMSKTLMYGTTSLNNGLSCTETLKATNNSGNCSMINKAFCTFVTAQLLKMNQQP